MSHESENAMTKNPTALISIFDLDGTVVDDSWRRSYLPTPDATPEQREVAFSKYHDLATQDRPHVLGGQRLREAIEAGHFIMFVTARPVKYKDRTVDTLTRLFSTEERPFESGIHYAIVMRQHDDTRDSVALKREMFNAVGAFAGEEKKVVAAYDDRIDVCEMYAETGVDTFCVYREHMTQVAADGTEKVVMAQDIDYVFSKPHPIPPQATAPERTATTGERAAEKLQRAIDTLMDRQRNYGDAYPRSAEVMRVLLPEGVTLRTQDDFRMFMMFSILVGKITRFAASGLRDLDSVHDLINYAAFCELESQVHAIYPPQQELN